MIPSLGRFNRILFSPYSNQSRSIAKSSRKNPLIKASFPVFDQPMTYPNTLNKKKFHRSPVTAPIPNPFQKELFAPVKANIPLGFPVQSTIPVPPSSDIELITLEKFRKDPLQSYEALSNRLKTFGFTASFPEFAPVVKHLEKELENPDVVHFINQNKFAQMQHKLAKMELFSLKYVFKVEDKDYPHKTNYGPYPYMPTINAIRRTMEFFDTFVRCTYKDVPPLYHTDRYMYHFNHVYDTNFVYFPIIDDLTLRDFLMTRAVPIGFLGISAKPFFADGYYNSPSDFFFHDSNHIRRYRSYNDLFQKKNQLEEKEAFAEMHRFFTEKMLPHIQIEYDMSEKEKDIRKVLELFYFEFVHEYALTPDLETLKTALLEKPGHPSPFEHLVESTFNPDELEKIRLPNNNLKSGFSNWQNKEEAPIIRYFFDKGPNFLTSAYNKCLNGFYDNRYARADYLPAYQKRTPQLFFRAAKRLLQVHQLESLIPDENLKSLFKLEGPLEKYPNQSLVQPSLLN